MEASANHIQQIRAGGLRDLAVNLSVFVGVHLLPMCGLSYLGGTVPRGSLRPQGLGHPPVLPKLFDQRKPPSVSSCHSNQLMHRGGLQGKEPARTRAAPFLCSLR